MKESGARVIRKDPGETGHHSKRLDGTCLLGRITGRSWTLTFAAFAPREALPGEAPRVSSSRGWPECDLLLQSLRHPHAQEILLVSALPRAHGSLAQLWAWNGRPVIRGASETQRKLLCNLPVLHGGVGGGCSPSPLPMTPMVLFTRPHPGSTTGRCWTDGHTGMGPTWSCMGSAQTRQAPITAKHGMTRGPCDRALLDSPYLVSIFSNPPPNP